MTANRTKITAAVLGILALGGTVAFNVTKDTRNRLAVLAQKVGRSDLVSIVSASGEVKPKRYVNVGCNVPGKIVKLYVKEGDRVKAGQVLVQIETTQYQAGEEQADATVQAQKADLEHAIADLANARLNYERKEKLYRDKLVAEQERDQAEADFRMKTADVEAGRRRLKQQQANFASVKDNLDKTTVVASMDGVVTSLNNQEGEMVIGAQSFQPTTIMTVADLSVMEVEIMVDETDIRNVVLGQPADVRVDALEGTKITGDVTEIGSSAIPRGSTTTTTTASNTNTGNQAKDFKVTVTIKNPPASLRPGLNATADITTARRQNALVVPIQAVVVREVDKQGKVIDPDALLTQSQGGVRTKGEEKDGVFVLQNAQAHFRPVRSGIVGETEIEILDGLKEGDEIVTGSYKTLRTLKDSARTRVETKKDKA